MKFDPPNLPLPIARKIRLDLATEDLFAALSSLPGRVWLDSATSSEASSNHDATDTSDTSLARYSFLTADPVRRLTAYPADSNPWPALAQLVQSLPTSHAPSLPPFQGGLVGVIGYEAARWLEPLELADCHQRQTDDLPTPAMSFGIYDWTIAVDHFSDEIWLICQGFGYEQLNSDPRGASADAASPEDTAEQPNAVQQRRQRAEQRAVQIETLLNQYQRDIPSPQSNARRARHKTCDSKKAMQSHPVRMMAPGLEFPDLIEQLTSPSSRVSSNFSSEQFQSTVAQIVQRIRNGESFQVNLAQRLTTPILVDAPELYLRLRGANPAPFAGFYDGGNFQVLSSSPEGFLKIRERHLETRPIKGTVPRTGQREQDERLAKQLMDSDKDRAENIMIVDLMRNDLSRVCEDRSVVVSQLCEIERYQFVQHLVSVVEGDMREGFGAVDAVRACFPGGSVTGAPKIEAMKSIAELEPNPRGPYCGAMGYFSCGGDADFNILIRTITAAGGQWQIPVGGGITARSIPVAEEAETWAKATGMLRALPIQPTDDSAEDSSHLCQSSQQ